MISAATLRIAAELAHSLTEKGHLLVPAGEGRTPVSIMADHYHVGAPGLKRPLSYDAVKKLRDDFGRYNNGEGNTISSEERDHLVSLLVEGQKKDLYNIRQVLVPIIKDANELIENRFAANGTPNIEIKAIEFAPFFESAPLLGHLEGYPRKFSVEETYKTIPVFASGSVPSHETLIEWMTAHEYAGDEAAAWALTIDMEQVTSLVDHLLVGKREFHLADVSVFRRHHLLQNADVILALYFITGYLRDNPEQVAGYSLDEWETIIGELHGMIGLKILEIIKLRQTYIQQKRLVVQSEVYGQERLESISVYVYVNGDTIKPWFENGGDVRALLGAAIQGGTLMHAKDIDAVSDQLVKRWEQKHHLIKIASMGAKEKRTRGFYRSVFDEVIDTHRGKFTEAHITVLRSRLRDVVNNLNDDELTVGWTSICNIACAVFYPNTLYRTFLRTMDERGKDLSSREAALLGHIETLALWYRQQCKLVAFTPDVVSGADSTLPTPGAVSAEPVAEDVAPAESEPEPAQAEEGTPESGTEED